MNLTLIAPFLFAFSAVCYAMLGMRLVGRRNVPGNLPLGLSFIAIGLWVFGGGIELIASNYLIFSLGRVGHFVGTSLIPVGMLICFRDYTGRHTSKMVVAALLVIPVLSIGFAATNYWTELMWLLPATNEAGEFLTRPVGWGPWFLYFHAPYGYTVVSVAILSLVMHGSAVAPAHRRGLMLLAGAAVIPIVAAIAYDVGIGPNTFSTLPIVFSTLLPIFAWLVIGEQVFEFSPLAYETVFQSMQDPVIVIDQQQHIIGLNHGAEKLLNVSESDAIRSTLGSVFGDDVPEVYKALDSGKPQNMLTNTGRFLHLQVTPIETNAGGARILMFRDVSDVQKAQQEVRSSEELLRTFIDHSVNGVLRMRWITDDSGQKSLKCIFANAAAGRFLHSGIQEIVGSNADNIVQLAASGMGAIDRESLLVQFLESAESGNVLDTESKVTLNGTGKWLRVIAEPVGENVAVTLVDVTDRKARELQMESIAVSDPLTGVLNRRGFEQEAAERLTTCSDNSTGALLFVDLNDFKRVNDHYGHLTGDQLLIIAAERIKASLRDEDIIGRPGGDEFVALVPDVSSEDAEELATRLTRSLQSPYLVGEETLNCAASIGLALYPQNATTLTGLLRSADQAMYRAKVRCRGVSVLGQSDLLEKATTTVLVQ